MKIEISDEQHKAIYDNLISNLQALGYPDLSDIQCFYMEDKKRFYIQVQLMLYCIDYTFHKDGSTTEYLRHAVGMSFDHFNVTSKYKNDTSEKLINRLINHTYETFVTHEDAHLMQTVYTRNLFNGKPQIWEASKKKLWFDR